MKIVLDRIIINNIIVFEKDEMQSEIQSWKICLSKLALLLPISIRHYQLDNNQFSKKSKKG